MKIYYYFDDVDFEYEISKPQIVEFLVYQMLKESMTPRTKESKKAVEFTIEKFNLWEDDAILDSYEDEIREYFEDYAKDCWEDSKDYEEDERDWFGTKANVIGL